MTDHHVLSPAGQKRVKLRVDALDTLGLSAIDRAKRVHAIIGEEARADGYSGQLGEFRFDAKDIAGEDEPSGTDRAGIIAEILSYHEGSGVGPSKSELEGKSDAYLVGRLEAVRQYAKSDGAADERVAHKRKRAAENGLATETEDDDDEKALAAARKRKAEATRGDAADYALGASRPGFHHDAASIMPATAEGDAQRCADLRQARVDAACAGMNADAAAEEAAFRKSVMRLDHATPVGSQNADAAAEADAYRQSVERMNAWRA